MSQLKGRQLILKTPTRGVFVDWDDMFALGGNGRTAIAAQKKLGVTMQVVGFLLLVVPLLGSLFQGELHLLNILRPASLIEILPWCGKLLLIVGWYLRRDRKVYSNKLIFGDLRTDLYNNSGKNVILLNDYLVFDIKLKLDEIYHKNPRNFLPDFGKYLVSDSQIALLLQRLGINKNEWLGMLERVPEGVSFDNNVNLLALAFAKGVELGLPRVGRVAFFQAINFGPLLSGLGEVGIKESDLGGLQIWLRNEANKLRYRELWEFKSLLKPKGVVNRSYTSRYAATLEKYGVDYTLRAASGDFVTSIGKEKEMVMLDRSLERESGTITLVIGEPGVGKSVFLRHLATRMVVEDVPLVLQDRRLVGFDFNKALTKSPRFEEFKDVFKTMLEEVSSAKNIVLLLDNVDQLFNIRDEYRLEIANLLVDAVDKFSLKLVATASSEGYAKYIKSLRSLSALMTTIVLPIPDSYVSFQILLDTALVFEKKYGIRIEVGAVKQIVDLAPKLPEDRVMPDRGVILLEECLLECRQQELKSLGSDVVDQVVSRKTGVNVGGLTSKESELLLGIEDKLHHRVVGQNQAVKAVGGALRRSRAGLQRVNKPVASFLFFGPTGVGKTEVAKALAEVYYGSESLMTRIDMSEYQEEQNLGRLIGRNEGGNFTGGYLTEAVRKRPFSLVLFDEIEKANPKVLDLFLQLLDEGYLTDGAGRKVDFTNTIVIATSNAASQEIASMVGQGQDYNSILKEVLPLLSRIFRVEFLNRFTKVIMFKTLSQIELKEVARKQMAILSKQLVEKGYGLEYTEGVLDQLIEAGYDPVFGARELSRVMQELIEDKIANAIVSGQLKQGEIFKLDNLDE